MIDRADYDAVSFDVYGTILDWEPRVPLAEGMEQTIAYFEQQLASAV